MAKRREDEEEKKRVVDELWEEEIICPAQSRKVSSFPLNKPGWTA
jgi:hypothetical protein